MLCVPGICHGHWLVYAQGSCHVGALSWTEARCIAILLMLRCAAMTWLLLFYFACLWPSLCCHANTGMVVWSLPIWQLWARLFFGQRQKEGEMEILKRRLNLVLIQLAVGGKKWNAICTLKIGHCLRENCSIQIMTLKRHWSESADRLSRKDITHMNRSFFTWL